MPNKKCTRQIQELQSRLRTAERVARTAIACMKSDASTFAIMRDVEWMQAPGFEEPKSLCTVTRSHLHRLAAELTATLGQEVSRGLPSSLAQHNVFASSLTQLLLIPSPSHSPLPGSGWGSCCKRRRPA
jgi:hypothetical protein